MDNIRGDYLVGEETEGEFDGYVNGQKWDVLDLGEVDELDVVGNGMRVLGKPWFSSHSEYCGCLIGGGFVCDCRVGRTVLVGDHEGEEGAGRKATARKQISRDGTVQSMWSDGHRSAAIESGRKGTISRTND